MENDRISQNASPGWLHADDGEDLQGDSAMQAPLLDGRRHHKAAEEEKIGFEEVLRADPFGWKDPQSREEADREHRCDGQRKGLCAPKHSHQRHHIKTFSLLKNKQHAIVNAQANTTMSKTETKTLKNK